MSKVTDEEQKELDEFLDHWGSDWSKMEPEKQISFVHVLACFALRKMGYNTVPRYSKPSWEHGKKKENEQP